MYAVESVEGCRIGSSRPLFRGRFPDQSGFSHDLMPDGRFLTIENPDFARTAPTIEIITNILDGLRRRVH